MSTKNLGIYIHIPFCKQKCNYCDFCSYAGKESLSARYAKSVCEEIKFVAKRNERLQTTSPNVKTIYIGGGTPSLIDSKNIDQILNEIKLNYKVDENAEITIEVNPGTVTKQKLQQYKQIGINRLSIGLQAVKPDLLKMLGRIHTYYDFLDTYRFARNVGFENINVDLMIGLPNQTLLDVKDALEEIISLEPEHISVYSLILEEGTKLEKQVKEKLLELPSEDEERAMYWQVKKMLEENGYKHYEISNFAKIENFTKDEHKESSNLNLKYASKHNLDCWNQEEYIGFGSAAHSYINMIRYSNIENVEKYVENIENRSIEKNYIIQERQNMEEQQKEYMLLGLRKIDDVSIQEFKNKFVANPVFLYHERLEKLVNDDLIEIDGDVIKLTDKGLDFANIVWEEFV